MINKSTNLIKVRSLIATAFLVASCSLGAVNICAEEVTDKKVEVKELEIKEKTESKRLKWNAKMGYIELPVNLKDINFNVLINGEKLASDNYSLNENKTTLFIHSEYLASLKLGEYKFQINNLDQDKLISELAITIVEEDKKVTSSTSINNTVDSKETKTSASAEENEATSTKTQESEVTSSETQESKATITDPSNKDEAVSSEDTTNQTSKKVVTPIRPEFDKVSENSDEEKKSDTQSNIGRTNEQPKGNLTAENSIQESSNKKSASTIASTGVGFTSITASSLIFTLSGAIVSVKRKLGTD